MIINWAGSNLVFLYSISCDCFNVCAISRPKSAHNNFGRGGALHSLLIIWLHRNVKGMLWFVNWVVLTTLFWKSFWISYLWFTRPRYFEFHVIFKYIKFSDQVICWATSIYIDISYSCSLVSGNFLKPSVWNFNLWEISVCQH